MHGVGVPVAGIVGDVVPRQDHLVAEDPLAVLQADDLADRERAGVPVDVGDLDV